MSTTAFEKMEHEGWSDPSIASGYATLFENATKQVAKELSDAVEAGGGKNVLDLCCGHGVVSKELVSRGVSVTGLDFSEAMVGLAKSNVPGANFEVGDATQTGFANQSFDAITIGFGIPHLPDPQLGLEEAARVLKPGGTLAFSIWQGKGTDGAFGWFFEAVGRFGDPGVTLPAGPDAHAFADKTIAEPALRKAGFERVILTECYSNLRLAFPEQLFDVFDKGAVRAASILLRQDPARRDQIRTRLAEKVEEHGNRVGDQWDVAMPSAIVKARLA